MRATPNSSDNDESSDDFNQKNHKVSTYINICLAWEMTKMKIRSFSVPYCVKKKKKKKI